jgi:hypothetical protein
LDLKQVRVYLHRHCWNPSQQLHCQNYQSAPPKLAAVLHRTHCGSVLVQQSSSKYHDSSKRFSCAGCCDDKVMTRSS